MPEQAEWIPEQTQSRNASAHVDARENYLRVAVSPLVRKPTEQPQPAQFDTRTLGDKVAELQAQVRHLELLVHRLMNPGETD